MIISKLISRRLAIQWITLRRVAHTCTCPTNEKKKPSCPPPGSSSGSSGSSGRTVLKRAEFSAKTRMGFIPEEWFLMFHPITGVSGPYVLGIVMINYLLSKEIYVCEHEFYLGISIFLMIYYVTKTFSSSIAGYLDKEVDAHVAEMEKSRKDEMAGYEKLILELKEAQMKAKGQQALIAAKKENVLMQQEAIYRERAQMVYKSVKGRMDYHLKRYHSEARIQQKWMLGWIMDQVMKSITPDFQKQALDKAISDLAEAAGRAK